VFLFLLLPVPLRCLHLRRSSTPRPPGADLVLYQPSCRPTHLSWGPAVVSRRLALPGLGTFPRTLDSLDSPDPRPSRAAPPKCALNSLAFAEPHRAPCWPTSSDTHML
jgi:hypothetical protein